MLTPEEATSRNTDLFVRKASTREGDYLDLLASCPHLGGYLCIV